MGWKNTGNDYGRVARGLHWIIAAMFIVLVATGVTADNLPRGDLRSSLFDLHKSLGISIIPLAALRLFWWFFNPPPAHLPMAAWMVTAAVVVHALLYVLMVSQPLTGLFMYLLDARAVEVFGLFSIEPLAQGSKPLAQGLRTVHEWSAFLIYALLGLHIGAALCHHLILKDNALRRMAGMAKVKHDDR